MNMINIEHAIVVREPGNLTHRGNAVVQGSISQAVAYATEHFGELFATCEITIYEITPGFEPRIAARRKAKAGKENRDWRF